MTSVGSIITLLAAATCVAVEAGSMTFLAMGDWGGQDSPPYYEPGEAACAKGMGTVAEQIGAEFVLALGDNFYESGIHGDATNFRFQKTFEDVYSADSLQIPFYVVAGNHDHLGNVSAQVAYTERSKRWQFPSLWYKEHFSFHNEDGTNTTLDIIFMDTVIFAGNTDLNENEFDPPPGPADLELAASQLDFVKQAIQESKADYLWVAGHYPVWSGCQHGPTLTLRLSIKPLLEQYNATGFVSGHDHCLEYIDDGTGPVYVVTGAADNCCYHNKHEKSCPAGSIKYHLWNDGSGSPEIGGFTSFHLTHKHMNVVYHAANGTVLYTSPDILPRQNP